MTVSLRLNQEDTELFKRYAAINNLSMSDMIRNAVLEKIEDEYDLQCYEKAITEYRNNPVTYSLAEVEKELGLWYIELNLLMQQKSN